MFKSRGGSVILESLVRRFGHYIIVIHTRSDLYLSKVSEGSVESTLKSGLNVTSFVVDSSD